MNEEVILNILINDINLFNSFARYGKSSYFLNEYCRFNWIQLNKFFNLYSRFPNSFQEYQIFFSSSLSLSPSMDLEELKRVVFNIMKPISYEDELATNAISNFLSSAITVEMIKNIKNLVDKGGDIDYPIKKEVDLYIQKMDYDLRKSNNDSVNLGDIEALNFLIEARSSPDRVMKSSLDSINKSLLYGGYIAGDVAMVIAPPGVGKSTFLINEGAHLAEQGFNVLHILVGDMNESDGALKYLSNFLNIPQAILSIMSSEERMQRIRGNENLIRLLSKLDILAYVPDEVSIEEVYRRVMDLQKEKRKHYDCIVLDYPENLREDSKGMDSMYEIGDKNYKTLAKLAKKNNSLVFTGSQPKNIYWSNEIIPMEAAAESSKKQHHVDIVMTIGAPSKVDDSVVNKLNICKVRRGSKRLASVRLLGEMSKFIEISDQDYNNIKAQAKPVSYNDWKR